MQNYINKLKPKIDTLYDKVISVLHSKKFTVFLLAAFAVQALFIALSFRYPMLYDESFHFGSIRDVYTKYLWPVVYNQPYELDGYRDLAAEGSRLFHSLSGMPQRLYEALKLPLVSQIVLHRVLGIVFVVFGLLAFVKLFDRLGIKRVYSNFTLIFMMIIPMPLFVAATINYDNALFVIMALFLNSWLTVFRQSKINIDKLLVFVVLGLTGSLVKFMFLPIFMFFAVVIVAKFIRQFHSKRKVAVVFERKGYIFTAALVAILTVLTVMFTQTYILNTIKYGTPRPTCQTTLGKERCLSNSIIRRNEQRISEAQNKRVEDIVDFSFLFSKEVLRTTLLTGSSRENSRAVFGTSSLIFKTALFCLSLIAGASLVYYWKDLKISREMQIILFSLIAYTLLFFLQAVELYYRYKVPTAIQARYLMLYLPVILLLYSLALSKAIASFGRGVKLVLLGLLIIFALQGGGIITHIARSESTWYWENSTVQYINRKAGDVFNVFIID